LVRSLWQATQVLVTVACASSTGVEAGPLGDVWTVPLTPP
jgi:hypothetical protein